jgi:hypothetical protein
MANDANLKVTELDFDGIKDSLKQYLRTQDTFKDYNFEGAGINYLLDILAYNTHYNAFYTNMVANEMFLDSSAQRDSVVSHAKHLGYTPNSVVGATAIVNVIGNAGQSGATLAAGKKFTASAGNKTFEFINLDAYAFGQSGATSGDYSRFVAENVVLTEGRLRSQSFVIDNLNPEQKFLIPANADTTSLTVRVQTSMTDNTGFTDVWSLATDLNDVKKTDKVYHLEETENGQFRVYFGDGIIGSKPNSGNVVMLTYVECKGEEANDVGRLDSKGSRTFTLENFDIEVISPAYGGADKETIASIKHYAPATYQAQNRAVTAKDYETLLLTDYPSVESLFVFGGEDANPPQYGKVFIAIKPKIGLTLPLTEKEYIKNQILKKRNLVSVTPELIDPDYTFLEIACNVDYDRNKTNLGKGSIEKLVNSIVTNYIDKELEKFDKDLYFSKLTSLIDRADSSILGNDTTIRMQKRFVPNLGRTVNYTISYGNKIYHPHDGHMSVIVSTPFIYKDDNNLTFYGYLGDDGKGALEIFKYSQEGDKVVVYTGKEKVGTVDYDTGILRLNEFRPIALAGRTSQFRISAIPNSKNIKADQNHILTIDVTDPNGLILNVKDIIEETNENLSKYTMEQLISPNIGLGEITDIGGVGSIAQDSSEYEAGGTGLVLGY